jgi:hypothetical protein
MQPRRTFLGTISAAIGTTVASRRGSADPRPRVAHVIVALADNEHQGLVPVPKALGDGKDFDRNLYWGAGCGMRTFFSRSPRWRKVARAAKPTEHVLERLVFRHATSDVFVIADAWDGERMAEALATFLADAAGTRRAAIAVDGVDLDAHGGSTLVGFVGHDGLMDLPAPALPNATSPRPDGALVVACFARKYFRPLLSKLGVPLWVGTTNLLSAEAYSVEAALDAWALGATPAAMRLAAGKAYAQWQKIAEPAGIGTFSTDATP